MYEFINIEKLNEKLKNAGEKLIKSVNNALSNSL